MTEPAVTLTDLALALQCALCALWLRAAGSRWPVLFFAALAGAATGGALVHGFLSECGLLLPLVWRLTLVCVGLAAFAGWQLCAGALPHAGAARVVRVGAALAFVVQAVASLAGVADFRSAVVFYLPALVLLMLVTASLAWRRRSRPLAEAALGLALALVASGLQQLRVGLHPVHFDHNALFHVLQMVALLGFYRGARALVEVRREERNLPCSRVASSWNEA